MQSAANKLFFVYATNSDGNSSDTTNQGEEMKRNYKDDGSSTMDETDWRSSEVEYMRFRTTQQKYNKNEYKYPQVRKTGVDAVHGSCPQTVYIMKRIVICNMCNDD